RKKVSGGAPPWGLISGAWRGLRAFPRNRATLAYQGGTLCDVMGDVLLADVLARLRGRAPAARKNVPDDHDGEHDHQDGGDGAAEARRRSIARGGQALRHDAGVRRRATRRAAPWHAMP